MESGLGFNLLKYWNHLEDSCCWLLTLVAGLFCGLCWSYTYGVSIPVFCFSTLSSLFHWRICTVKCHVYTTCFQTFTFQKNRFSKSLIVDFFIFFSAVFQLYQWVALQLLQALNFIGRDYYCRSPFVLVLGSIVSVVCSFVKPEGWSPIRWDMEELRGYPYQLLANFVSY